MLCRIMFFIEPWYGTNQLFKQLKSQENDHNYDQTVDSTEGDGVPNSIAALLDGRMSRNENDVTKEHIDIKLERIHNHQLRIVDLELYNHLKTNDIIPQVYGIRWLRLLFGREFSHEDSLTIWDYIFANLLKFDDISNVTDMMFVAMLVQIRKHLLAGGEQICVTNLMKYPKINDISEILNKTSYLLINFKMLEDTFLARAPLINAKSSLKNLLIDASQGINNLTQNMSGNMVRQPTKISPENLYSRQQSQAQAGQGLLGSNSSQSKGQFLRNLTSPMSNLSINNLIQTATDPNKTPQKSISNLSLSTKASLDYFTNDVSSSLSDWKKSLSKNFSNLQANQQNHNDSEQNVKLACAKELSFSIKKLQAIIYDKTDKVEGQRSSQSQNSNNGSIDGASLSQSNSSETPNMILENQDMEDNKNLADLCLILANLKHTRDVLKGILPVSSLGQLS